MCPRGGNGAAQSILDAAALAGELKQSPDPQAALQQYEQRRRPATSRVVLLNRTEPPDGIITRVEELTGGRPFSRIDDVISQTELRAISDNYKRVTEGAGLRQDRSLNSEM